MQISSENEKRAKHNKRISESGCGLIYIRYVKRGLDIGISFGLLIILAVPMLIIAGLIKIDSPKEKVLFRQQRIGKNDIPFTILKFRTMESNAPHHMATENFENAKQYITKIGGFLRKSSLDELPQLINVLKGDMSLIGPRPLISDLKFESTKTSRSPINFGFLDS